MRRKLRFSSERILFFLTFIFFFCSRIIMHFNLQTNYFDQLFFDNPLWNTIHGKLMWVSVPDSGGQILLGGHFSLLLFVFALPYFIHPSPFWMFGFQALFVAGLAAIIYRFAKINLDRSGTKLVLILLLTNVTFRYMGLHDFHQDIVISFLVSLALFLLLTGHKPLYSALILLSGFLVKEIAGVVISSFGVYLLCFRREKILGFVMFIVGLAGTAVIAKEIIPHFHASGSYMFSNYYAHFGSNIYEQFANIIIHPLRTMAYIILPENLFYLFLLLAPAAFLPLFSPQLTAIGWLPLLENFLSNYRFQKDISTQYSYIVLPIIFFSTILAIKSLQAKDSWPRFWRRAKPGIVFFIALSLIAAILLNSRFYIPTARVFAAHKIMKMIPAQAPLAASDRLIVHCQYRERLYRFPDVDKTEYVFFDDIDWWYLNEPGNDLAKLQKLIKLKRYGRIFSLIFLGAGQPNQDYARDILKFRRRKDFVLLINDSGICLYRKSK
ncbi:DUF2079 domain-containing protein [Candidatus Saganbacteria bacterium]|nr:DUF2079 domain-containing protein [Candidatus Saganbacteria bacterium]